MMNKTNLIKAIGLVPLICLNIGFLPYSPANAEEPVPPPIEDTSEPEPLPEPDSLPTDDPSFDEETMAETPAQPASPFTYRIELEGNSEYTSNVKQTTDGEGDFIFRTGLSATMRYTFPTNTQILFRGQAMINRYFKLSDYNQTLVLGTFTLSQWLLDSLNIYAGVIPIYLKADTDLSITRFDTDLMGGLTYYYLVGSQNILFGGYQLDSLIAQDTNYRYMGHTLLAGYRHTLTPELNLTATGRGQFRFFTEKTDSDEQRFVANAILRYSPLSWLSFATKGEYTYVNSANANKTGGFYTLGLNVIGGF